MTPQLSLTSEPVTLSLSTPMIMSVRATRVRTRRLFRYKLSFLPSVCQALKTNSADFLSLTLSPLDAKFISDNKIFERVLCMNAIVDVDGWSVGQHESL